MFKIIHILFLLFSLSSQASTNKQQQVDQLLASWDSNQNPGIAVAVNQGEQTIYQEYRGLAELEHSITISHNTKFLIASVSKQFTAFAIALLADEKKLSLEDDVRKYIPELPKYEQPITILHLLNHSSGLRDADDLNGLVGAGLSDYVSFNDVYKLIIKQQKLNFIPGSQFDYSNSGYILLAKIVENISKKKFRVFMAERVFNPLQMNNTLVFDNPFEVIGNKAIAYYSNDGTSHSKNNLFSSVYGSSGIYTTLSDLNRWAKNFTHPKVGNKTIFKTMATQGTLNNGEIISYALGQEIKTHNGYKAIFHGGGQGAYRAYLMRFPELELSINILSNSSYSTAFILDYANQIADIYIGNHSEVNDNTQTKIYTTDSIKEPSEALSVETETMTKYTGDYQIQPGLIFTVKIIEDALHLFITGNEKSIPLAPKSNNEFNLTDSDNGYWMAFDTSNSDQSQFINYHQGDMEYIGKRVNLVKYDQQKIQWLELEGLYYSEELNTIYNLKYNGNNLVAHHTRNLPITLKPHQPDVFTGAATYFQEIKFMRDYSHQITSMFVSGSRSKYIEFLKVNKTKP